MRLDGPEVFALFFGLPHAQFDDWFAIVDERTQLEVGMFEPVLQWVSEQCLICHEASSFALVHVLHFLQQLQMGERMHTCSIGSMQIVVAEQPQLV